MIHRIRNRAGVSWRRWELWWQDHGEEAEKVLVMCAFFAIGWIVLIRMAACAAK